MNPSKEFYAENPSWNIISKLFNLSKKEFVFDDFSCSLWNKILLPGHLYCMENHICFYSDMMGTESKVTKITKSFSKILSMFRQS